MEELFKENDIEKIANILQCEWKKQFNSYRFTLADEAGSRKLILEIYPDIQIGNKKGNVISVLTENSHLQLQFCTGYVVSEINQEVTFYSEFRGKVSGLIVEKEAGCSMYANVDKEVLSGDWSNLGPEVMLSGVALSLTESFIEP